MDGMGLAGEQARVYTAVPGVDGDSLTLAAGVADAAQLADPDHAVGIDSADDKAHGIGVGAYQNGLAVVLALQDDVRGAPAIIGHLAAEALSLLLQNRI